MEYLGSDTTPASPRNLDEIITEGSVWKISDAVSKCTSLVKLKKEMFSYKIRVCKM